MLREQSQRITRTKTDKLIDLKVTACAVGTMTLLSAFWAGVGYLFYLWLS